MLDCTDNVATRYLINDACVIKGKPLVSGSALRLEGQVVVYNYQNGPCYRCLYPTPPPVDSVTSCSEGGVIGVGKRSCKAAFSDTDRMLTHAAIVTGIIGLQQAAEAMRLCLAAGSAPDDWIPHMYMTRVSLKMSQPAIDVRRIRLRNKQPNCVVCGNEPSIRAPLDASVYVQECALNGLDTKTSHLQRITALVSCS